MNKIISTTGAPSAIGPYSQGVCAGELVFLSGQVGLCSQTGVLSDSVTEQARQAMENMGAILREAGLGYQNVVKTTVFLTDLGNFAAVNEVYGSYFPQNMPARSCVQVAALPRGAAVEVEAIARR